MASFQRNFSNERRLMSMLNLFALIRRSAKGTRNRQIALGAVVVLSLGLACVASASSPKAAGTSGQEVLIPCFHRAMGDYTAETEPTNCDIAGRRNGEAFVEVPVAGMRWGGWRSFRAFGAHGKTKAFTHRPRGTGVRVIAFHRVACGDGRNSYSKVNVFYPGSGLNIEVKLPPCNAPSVRG